MTKREAVADGAQRLLTAGVPDAQHDARELFLAAAGEDLACYAASMGEEVPEAVFSQFESMILRRASREPLQYILGRSFFYGREFAVQKGVLIPRFDTETLIEAVLPRLREGMRILDLCTGSGCIVITLLLEGPGKLSGCGSDLSDTALKCAQENAARLEADASFIKSDLFQQIEGKYDIITVNPPYIPTEEIRELDAEVRDFEPRMALDGSGDGLHFYREICAAAGGHLEEGGCLAAEIGAGQGEDVERLFLSAGFRDVIVADDLSGRERVVLGVYRK